MKNLNRTVKTLMLDAVGVTGSYDPKETLDYFAEHLTFKEAMEVGKFMNWVHADVANRCFGSGNIDDRFADYLQHKIRSVFK